MERQRVEVYLSERYRNGRLGTENVFQIFQNTKSPATCLIQLQVRLGFTGRLIYLIIR